MLFKPLWIPNDCVMCCVYNVLPWQPWWFAEWQQIRVLCFCRFVLIVVRNKKKGITSVNVLSSLSTCSNVCVFISFLPPLPLPPLPTPRRACSSMDIMSLQALAYVSPTPCALWPLTLRVRCETKVGKQDECAGKNRAKQGGLTVKGQVICFVCLFVFFWPWFRGN